MGGEVWSVRYAELQTTTNFSFLRGGSHAEELVEEAARLGHSAIGIADRHTLAGVVRAHVAAKKLGYGWRSASAWTRGTATRCSSIQWTLPPTAGSRAC
jgi:PHP domain